MRITSRENPRVKQYILLRDKKSARKSDGLFVIEGARLALDAIKEGVKLEFAFFSDSAAEHFPDAVSALSGALGERLYSVDDALAQKLAGTVATQGIFAVAARLDKNLPSDKIVYGGKYLVLDSLQDPGNVGTILRAADAMGVSGVYLCDCCDLYNPKLIRSTMGSVFRLKTDDSMSFGELAKMFSEAQIPLFATVVDSKAKDIRSFDFPESCAVVIGNEGSGLSDEDVALCSDSITIRMKGSIESLNAASAATVFLWELMK